MRNFSYKKLTLFEQDWKYNNACFMHKFSQLRKFIEPISKIHSGRVVRYFLVSARRVEEAVAQATATKAQHSGTRKYPQPQGDTANFG